MRTDLRVQLRVETHTLDKKRFSEKFEVGDKTLFLLQTSGLKNLKEAKAFCLILAANDIDCTTATLN